MDEGFRVLWPGFSGVFGMRLKVWAMTVILFASSMSFERPTIALSQTAGSPPTGRGGWRNQNIASSQSFEMGGVTIQVDFASGDLDLEPANVLPWVQDAARAVTVYYGRFPEL